MTSSARRTTSPGSSARARPERAPTASPPPPLVMAPPWSAQPVEPASPSVEVVARWMSAPHVARHWHQDWPGDEWVAEIEAQLAGNHSRPWLVSHDGEPVAYVELYRIAVDVLAERIEVDAHDVGVHVAVGDEARTGQGIGSGVLRAVAAAVFAADPACRRVIGDPDAAHVGAHHALVAAGYELDGEVELPHKRAAIMVSRRPRGEVEP